MSKQKVSFTCTTCGGISNKWQGQCPHCSDWNTLTEQAHQSTAPQGTQNTAATVHRLTQIQLNQHPRISSGFDELDRVLGGGLLPGAVILIGGDPGIGKSTLLLQCATQVAAQHKAEVAYVSGEESPQQVATRAQRLAAHLNQAPIAILSEVCLENILTALNQLKPIITIIDSIQTLYTRDTNALPGSITQVRECAIQLTQWAKQSNCTLIIIGHVTKEGALAGPRLLEHIVDTVLYFEGDGHSPFRLIRSSKNRFGAVNELGVFAMTDVGLKTVRNPSTIFLSQHSQPTSGSIVLVTLEGSRPLLIEIQALLSDRHGGSQNRLSMGIEIARLSMLLVILHKHAGVFCLDKEIFVNVVGGLKISETAADLAVLLAVYSSLCDKKLPQNLIAFGELGLAGEIRPAPKGQQRLKEAAKLGFQQAIVPAANCSKTTQIQGMKLYPVARLAQAIDILKSL